MDSKYEIYYIYDEPVEYKKLTIHPIIVRNALMFYSCIDCLLVDKNSVPDINVISMTYLDYLFYADNDSTLYLTKLDALLKLTLKTEDINYGKVGKKSAIEINGELYYSQDFDEIRKIICEQNSVEMIDEEMRKETRDELDKAKKTKERLTSSSKMCGFEDQQICISISTGLTLEDVKNLTLRKFKKYLNRIDHEIHYKIYKTAVCSGFVDFKDKNFPKHWMADLENEDKYADVLVDEEEVKNKIEST